MAHEVPAGSGLTAGAGRLQLVLRYAGEDRALPDDRLLQGVYGEGWRQSYPAMVSRMLEAGSELRVRADALLALGSEGVRVVMIHDDPDRIFPGESFAIPMDCGGRTSYGRVRVRPGEQLGELAALAGTTVGETVAWNPERFRILPHTRRPSGFGGSGFGGGSQAQGPEIWLPATPRPGVHWEDPGRTLAGIVIHEVAHVPQAPDPSVMADMGPDGKHQAREVTTPRLAWKEGLPGYLGSRVDPFTASIYARGLTELAREAPDSSPRETRLVPLESPGWEDYLASEAFVVEVLTGLVAGDPERDAALFDAFAASNQPGSQLGDALAAYLLQRPGDQLRLQEVLDHSSRGTAPRIATWLRSTRAD